MSDEIVPQVGKVYWIRIVRGSEKHAPQRVEILRLTPKIVEYRNNNWSAFGNVAMRDEVEFVEESQWD